MGLERSWGGENSHTDDSCTVWSIGQSNQLVI
ncbi:Uncharacterised protein [Vibrio cholerae]|nr:Uncharacterised protein [Vibrio cholerae]